MYYKYKYNDLFKSLFKIPQDLNKLDITNAIITYI